MAEGDTITREAALRIGMAARALPGIEVRELVSALAGKLGLPLTADKLTRVTVADIKALVQNDEEAEPAAAGASIKAAARYLRGEGIAEQDLPVPEPYADGDMPNSLRVAVASNSGSAVDGHFGSCARFLVYQVSRQEARLIAVRSTLGTESAEDKNVARVQLISDCHLVYVQSIGGPAAAKVVRGGAHPVKVAEGGPAADALRRLQGTLDTPSPWLAKIMGVSAASLARFAADAER